MPTSIERDVDKLMSAIKLKYKTPRAFCAHLGLDEAILDNPRNTEQNMDADQVIAQIKALVLDLSPADQDAVMDFFREMADSGDLEQAAETHEPPAPTGNPVGDRYRMAHDAKVDRMLARSRGARQLGPSSAAQRSFDQMFPSARRLGVA